MAKRSNPALWLLSLGNGGVDRPFNDAVGGTVTEIEDGQYPLPGRWRVHTFTGNGTLDVSTAVNPFRVLVVAGGGAGGAPAGDWGQGGGGAGGMLSNDAATLSATQYSVTVGTGGTPKTNGGDGTDSSLQGVLSCSGGGSGGGKDQSAGRSGGSGGGGAWFSAFPNGGGGSGISGQGHAGGGGTGAPHGGGGAGSAGNGSGGSGRASDITGTNVTYSRGGAAEGKGSTPAGPGNGGNGNQGGSNGVVIVAYRIG